VDLVLGTRELAWYQLGGLFNQQAFSAFLQKNGTAAESFNSILDFGCGCGRLVRTWGRRRGREMFGCDYNPDLVAWCQRKLSSIATFKVNNADPPLDFPDEAFDFIYSYSVFTHLSEDRQKSWMTELVRVLRPGGMVLVTVHGKRAAGRAGLSAKQLQQMDDRGIVVLGEDKSGTNICSVFHSEAYMHGHESLGLILLDFLPGGVRDPSEQDLYLYRKRT
jgi:SAM-dependent methyltransferase